MKYTRFRDIPQFTQAGSWECDFALTRVTHQLKEHFNVDLNPDFQRGHIWTEEQQIALIEFFLRGGKTGRVLYFNCPTWHTGNYAASLVIVDGKQRLEAIRRFTENEIKVFGSYLEEFTDGMRMHQTIRLNVNDLQTRAEVLDWYLQINSGGTPHTDEEISRVRELLKAETGK